MIARGARARAREGKCAGVHTARFPFRSCRIRHERISLQGCRRGVRRVVYIVGFFLSFFLMARAGLEVCGMRR